MSLKTFLNILTAIFQKNKQNNYVIYSNEMAVYKQEIFYNFYKNMSVIQLIMEFNQTNSNYKSFF